MYDESNNSIFFNHKHKIKKKIFRKILTKCSENIFIFNNEVYQQIDGLSMGSPLAPILANWFVNKVESRLLQDTKVKQPKFYRRYVDDIFAIFESTRDRDKFFSLLNNSHKNLEFTMENMDSSKRSLPFLDVEVRFNNPDRIETTVYRKPTNTNVLMHFDSMAPKQWKKSIIKCFLNRAARNTSSKQLLDEEILRTKEIFTANGYPYKFIERTINEYMVECGNSDNKLIRKSVIEHEDNLVSMTDNGIRDCNNDNNDVHVKLSDHNLCAAANIINMCATDGSDNMCDDVSSNNDWDCNVLNVNVSGKLLKDSTTNA